MTELVPMHAVKWKICHQYRDRNEICSCLYYPQLTFVCSFTCHASIGRYISYAQAYWFLSFIIFRIRYSCNQREWRRSERMAIQTRRADTWMCRIVLVVLASDVLSVVITPILYAACLSVDTLFATSASPQSTISYFMRKVEKMLALNGINFFSVRWQKNNINRLFC